MQTMRRKWVFGLLSLLTWALSLGSTAADEVALTIYSGDFALVREVRTVALPQGRESVRFTDVAAQIDPTSVRIRSLTAPQKVSILEQNYEYDLIDSRRLLQKYVDQNIRLLAKDERFFEGTLLSAADDLILRDLSGQIKIIKAAEVQILEFPQLPEGLITKPTLVWLLESQRSGSHQLEVSYLTDGVDWHAEYVATVDQDDAHLELGGWVSIDNRSGVSYQDAKLKLVAGDVHRVTPKLKAPEYQRVADVMAGVGAPQFEEEAFFEYHLYTLTRPATIADRQIKQLTLFPEAGVVASKILTYDGRRSDAKVQVNLEFDNSQQNGLGIPLPEGTLRVYKMDAEGSLQFVGEDLVEHTPKDEKVRVFLGHAFDVVGERKRTQSQKITDRSREESYEIRIRNHKEETVEVVVVEHLPGDWTIRQSSHHFKKKDANTVEFSIEVPSDGEVVVTYTAHFRW
jgi:hypothetical protein